MPYDHKDWLAQVGLKTTGHDPGPLDGWWGDRSEAAFRASKAARFGGSSAADDLAGGPPRPGPTYREKVKVFGEPGREQALKRVRAPWEMPLAWGGGTRKTLRLHHLIGDRFVAALEAIRDQYGMDYVRKHGLHLFGGDYNHRPTRTGSGMSDHAWGIAVDLNPDANGLFHTWNPGAPAGNGTHEMPRGAVAIFRRHGFQVGFRRRDGSRRDMMHVAYVDRP